MRLSLLIPFAVFLVACGNKQPDLASGQETQANPLPQIATLSNYFVRWSSNVGGSNGENTALVPYIGKQTAFVASETGAVRGIELSTGKQLWSSRTDGRITAGAGVGATVVVVGLHNGDVVGFDPKSGKQKWQSSLGRVISAHPVVSAQTVVVRTQDGHIFGIHAATGESIWGVERPISSLSIGKDATSLIVDEGVISGFSSGRLLASSLFSGQPFWEKRAFRPNGNNEIARLIDMDAKPLLVETDVIVGAYQGGIASYQVRNGELNWLNETTPTRKDMFAVNGVVYVTQSSGAISAVDAKDGSTLWTQSALVGRGISSPVVFNDQVVVGGLNGNLFALDPKTGVLQGRMTLGNSTISNLSLSNQDLIVFARSAGRLSAVSAL